MNVAVIWIDREHANLYMVSNANGGVEASKFKGNQKNHHTHMRDSADRRREEHTFFREAGKALEKADKIFILGPGVAKHHFRTYLNEELPMVAKKVERVENSDHPTDAQISALAREFFDKATA